MKFGIEYLRTYQRSLISEVAKGWGDQVNTPSRLTNRNIIVALVIDVDESVTLQNTTDA